MNKLSLRGSGGPSRLVCTVALLGGVAWAAGCGDGATEPAPATPDPPRPTTVMVSPATAALTALGATVQLAVEVRDQNGQAMAGATVTWATDSAEVATVNSSGLVTAAGNGTSTITATAGSVSGTAAVTVAQEVGAVAVSPDADTLVAGDTVRLAAEATDANGHAVSVSEFMWASSDTAVATVDASGLATSVGAGETEVTATASGITGRAVLTVVNPAPAAITITPDTVALTALGQTAELTAQVHDQIGRVMAGVQVSWSSADVAVAAVDSAGLVTAIGIGAATVTASAGEASGGVLVMVMQSAGSVVVFPAADTIAPGDTLQLAAQAFDENGNGIAGAEFEWSSSDESVATVDASGLVRGVAEGGATITAGSGDARGTAQITVQNPDRAALAALYQATDGPNWTDNENWLTDAPLGEWFGVRTDGSGRVVALDLSGSWDNDARKRVSHGLSGPIPSEIGSLANLTYLDLDWNELSGPIPPELGDLANLTGLQLFDNDLSGPIPPEFGGLANLTRLSLGSNELSGPIPPELGDLANLTGLSLDSNELFGPIPPELGGLANLTRLSLGSNELSGPIPPELGELANLTVLYLDWNELSGPIPPELGDLANLTVLHLKSNELSGPIPQRFLQLDKFLRFYIGGNKGLCVPGTSAFVAWLQGIKNQDGGEAFCNAADLVVLRRLYETAGGVSWSESAGWSGDGAVDEWHGVTADSLGRVTALDLGGNGLSGRLPATLYEMAHLTELRIGGNPRLSGRLPLSLVDLSLRTLHYSGTGLCAPPDRSFRDWLGAIPSHEGTGVECARLLDRDILQALYDATEGPKWRNSDNWLTDAPLNDWYGITADGEGRVETLKLIFNDLSGPIPRELGELANLRELSLSGISGSIPPQLGNLANLNWLELIYSNLSGPIPPELGSLANLEKLDLYRNELSGPIPPELGNLASLRWLNLTDNALSGPIPPELGNLARLLVLTLKNNALSGPIPPELDNLVSLSVLDLRENALSGPIPPELGNLARLTRLNLSDNALSGSIAPELGRLVSLNRLELGRNELSGGIPPGLSTLSNLSELSLAANARMSGPIPASLTELRSLRSFHTGGTKLCVPSDPTFIEWLDAIPSRRVARCDSQPAATYLVQATQSREFPVPLVAGEEAMLRVFPAAARANDAPIPLTRASFFVSDRLVHTVDIPGKPGPIPIDVDEGSLGRSVNAVIPANVVRTGLEMVVEIDPDGTLDPGMEVAGRIPGTGRLAVDVRTMPMFDLTVVPFLWTVDPDSSFIEPISEMSSDPENHGSLWHTRTLLPVAKLAVTAHEPVLTSNTLTVLGQTEAIRVIEGGVGHYMGTISMSDPPFRGVALRSGRASAVSALVSGLIAHELGHNFSLDHAPCGGAAGLDPGYPYLDGSIGAWGWDFRDGGRVVQPRRVRDLMSYCGPVWISDYHFDKALRFRLADESAPGAAASAAPVESLLLWGGTDAEGRPYLEPAFVVDAPPSLPRRPGGEYEITGRAGGGEELFSFRFDMPEMADGDGSSSFAFALPVRDAWAGALASITLSGLGGSATLDQGTDRPVAILRNPDSGQVRGILYDLPPPMQAAMDAAGRAAGQGLEVLFSRGIPEVPVWPR